MSGFPKRTAQYEAGWDARFEGKSMLTCPHVENSAEGKQWVKGWIEADQYLRQQPQG
jgi:ribosome modulation factor